MLTLFDVLALCEDEERLQEWLRSYGVLRVKATKCVSVFLVMSKSSSGGGTLVQRTLS